MFNYRYHWKKLKEKEEYKRWNRKELSWLTSEMKRKKTIHHFPLIENKYDLRAINLKKTHISEIIIKNANLDNSQFYSSQINNVEFIDSTLIDADFTSTILTDVCFQNCILIDASFNNAKMNKVSMINCSCEKSSFKHLNVIEMNLINVKLDYGLMWKCHGVININADKVSAKKMEIDRQTYNKVRNKELKEVIKRDGIIKEYEYDIAISFSGDDRAIAEKIAKAFQKRDIKVFYDNDEVSNLWGENLEEKLTNIFRNRAKLCLILVSKSYMNKYWTRIELKAALTEYYNSNKKWILPIKLDETIYEILPREIGYLEYKNHKINEIVSITKEKLDEIYGTEKNKGVDA